jgi:hypothetical protein
VDLGSRQHYVPEKPLSSLVSRNGGHKWTPDFVCQVENPLDPSYPYTILDGCPKGVGWF